MKKSTSAFLFCVVLGYAANAQKFTLLPQVGLETSKTLLQYNSLPSFAPKAVQLSPRLGIRMDYAFKKIGGPYLGVSTSRSSVAVNFSSPESGMNVTNVSTGAMQLRLEAGYQISSKPIYLNKSGAAKKTAALIAQRAAAIAAAQKAASSRSRCGSYCSRYRSEAYNNSLSKLAAPITPVKGWYVAIQPSVGLAYIPFLKSSVSTQMQDSKTSINYVAGNMSSAFVAGTGFEFGENTDKKFNVSIQYIKGIGNLDTRSVSTVSGSKSTTTTLGSSVSGWNVSLGIPISLSKKKAVVKPVPVMQERKIIQPQQRSRCGQYYRSFQSL